MHPNSTELSSASDLDHKCTLEDMEINCHFRTVPFQYMYAYIYTYFTCLGTVTSTMVKFDSDLYVREKDIFFQLF